MAQGTLIYLNNDAVVHVAQIKTFVYIGLVVTFLHIIETVLLNINLPVACIFACMLK